VELGGASSTAPHAMGDGNTMNAAIYKRIYGRLILGGTGDLCLHLPPIKLHSIPCPPGTRSPEEPPHSAPRRLCWPLQSPKIALQHGRLKMQSLLTISRDPLLQGSALCKTASYLGLGSESSEGGQITPS
jgi:hypothetical protein